MLLDQNTFASFYAIPRILSKHAKSIKGLSVNLEQQSSET